MKINNTHGKASQKKTMQRNKDDAVTSVVGEMLMIGIAIVLVGIFAITAYSLVPDERTPTITVGVEYPKTDTDPITIWHKGGDWIEAQSLSLTLTPEDEGSEIKKYTLSAKVSDEAGSAKNTFDLGYKAEFDIKTVPPGTYSLRIVGKDTLLWAKDRVKVKLS